MTRRDACSNGGKGYQIFFSIGAWGARPLEAPCAPPRQARPWSPDAPAGRLRVARQAAPDPPDRRGWRKGAWATLGSPRGVLQWHTSQLGREGQTVLCGLRAGLARPGGAREAPLRVGGARLPRRCRRGPRPSQQTSAHALASSRRGKLATGLPNALRTRRAGLKHLAGRSGAGPAARPKQGGRGSHRTRRPRPLWARGRPGGRLRGGNLRLGFVARLDGPPCCAARGGVGTTLGQTPSRSCGRARRSGVNGPNPAARGSGRRQPVPKLAIRPAWPPDGRPACSTGVLRPPGPTEHARLAHRGHRVDRHERALLWRHRLRRRRRRAA